MKARGILTLRYERMNAKSCLGEQDEMLDNENTRNYESQLNIDNKLNTANQLNNENQMKTGSQVDNNYRLNSESQLDNKNKNSEHVNDSHLSQEGQHQLKVTKNK